MKTSFKKAMKSFLKSVPGISYLTHEEYLTGAFGKAGFCLAVYVQGGVCPRGFMS